MYVYIYIICILYYIIICKNDYIYDIQINNCVGLENQLK